MVTFCILAAAIFHHQIGVPAERSLFFKDIARPAPGRRRRGRNDGCGLSFEGIP
jgi:hypothetical protein